MHVIFSVLDSNKNGYISIDELVHCMPECEVELIQLIQLRFNEADQDKDGQLSFDEFTELLTVNDKLRNSTLSLPDLRREDVVGISSLTFSNTGNGLYLSSSSELQQMSL